MQSKAGTAAAGFSDGTTAHKASASGIVENYRKGYATAREMLLEYKGKVQAQGAEIRATTGPASPFHQATWRSTAVNIIAMEMLLGFRESPWGWKKGTHRFFI
jgi:hypothetical protein